jgi:cell division control protein 7
VTRIKKVELLREQIVMVMEYFEHSSFKSYFKLFSVRDIGSYMHALISAVSIVHRHGITHRDIKPSNFLRSKDA